MNTKLQIMLAITAGVVIGAAGVQGLHAQAKPKAYTHYRERSDQCRGPKGLHAAGPGCTKGGRWPQFQYRLAERSLHSRARP